MMKDIVTKSLNGILIFIVCPCKPLKSKLCLLQSNIEFGSHMGLNDSDQVALLGRQCTNKTFVYIDQIYHKLGDISTYISIINVTSWP